MWCVWCGTLQNSRVYIRNVPVCTGNTSARVNTCGCGAGTHGDVLDAHAMGGGGREGRSWSVLLTKICPRRVITRPRGSTKKPMDVTFFQFQNRSRTTRCPVLHLFASPEHTVQLQTHDTAQHSTAQHSTAQHSTAQHSTAQHRPHRSKEKRRRDEKRYKLEERRGKERRARLKEKREEKARIL